MTYSIHDPRPSAPLEGDGGVLCTAYTFGTVELRGETRERKIRRHAARSRQHTATLGAASPAPRHILGYSNSSRLKQSKSLEKVGKFLLIVFACVDWSGVTWSMISQVKNSKDEDK
jgi:hypothetical protein